LGRGKGKICLPTQRKGERKKRKLLHAEGERIFLPILKGRGGKKRTKVSLLSGREKKKKKEGSFS